MHHFQLLLESIFSRLDETDVRLLLRAWSARTSQEESPEIKTPQDLKRAMEKTGCFRTGDLVVLEKDMMSAGISFPVIVRDIPGVPDEFQYPRIREASVGPVGGEVEIPGFVKLVVPPGALQQETMITVSTVDVPGILRGPEGVNWISGYPWSLDEDACPRELLEQVLFSPAVDVNLHGVQLAEPVELETRRPSGSEGMGCILLKHHDGEGWTDITASTEYQIYPDRISVSLLTFSPLDIVWVPVNMVITTGKWMVDTLSSRTLNCSFAAYAKPHRENVTFHVVCRDRQVETDEYRPGFTRWGYNDAWSDLYHGDSIEVAVTVHGGKEKTELMNLRTMNCRDRNGQNVQMLLDRPTGGGCVEGEVTVKTPRAGRVCQLVFKEEDDVSTRDGTGMRRTSQKRLNPSPLPAVVPEKKKKQQKGGKGRQADQGAGPSGARKDSEARDSEETIEDLITNNYTLLRRRLQVEKLIPHFIERRMLDFPDKQVVMSKTTTSGKAGALLELLTQKGTCKPEEFVEILEKGDHRHVVDQLKITSTRNKITKGDDTGMRRTSQKRPRSSPLPAVVPEKKKKKKQKGGKGRQADHGRGPSGARKDSEARDYFISDVSKYFRYIKTNVAGGWEDLAGELGFSRAEITTIRDRDGNKDYKTRCQDMLGEWQTRKGNDATIDVLMNALEDLELKKVADGLKNKYPELKDQPDGDSSSSDRND
ncbi:Hypp1561 [Branchiostoma lanceolatum]|uniref:Hypp1561 protein n=1 Tax=Branchiostoma lanceolatum TaxID=7740 RepID=A0A8J9ZKB3_BRALA|nr:Hypp1561 [Branchiostoma lanceolatum]